MMSPSIKISVHHEEVPLAGVFRISRGSKVKADVIVVRITDENHQGWAESVPYARYGETINSVIEQVLNIGIDFESTENIEQEINKLPAGSAKNALDCALLDYKAKVKNVSVVESLSLEKANKVVCAQTLSIDTPEAMAVAVEKLNNPPLVKVKLDNNNIIGKMQAIAAAAPNSSFIIDANEAWSFKDLVESTEQLKKLNVILIEQPLPQGKDDKLSQYESHIPLCADESCHTSADLAHLKHKYQVINIKLDKTGGLTEAIKLAKLAKQADFTIMVGCMVGTSLAMAPASLLTPYASFVDLDGPILIKEDRENGFSFSNGVMSVLNPYLWGGKVS